MYTHMWDEVSCTFTSIGLVADDGAMRSFWNVEVEDPKSLAFAHTWKKKWVMMASNSVELYSTWTLYPGV